MEIKTTFLFIISILNSFLALLVVLGQKNLVGKVFGLFVVLLSFWSLGLALFLNATSVDSAYFFANSYYVIGATFVSLFLLFSRVFPAKKKFDALDFFIVVTPSIFLSILFLSNKYLFLKDITLNGTQKSVSIDTVNYAFFLIFLFIYLSAAFENLLNGYRKATNHIEKAQYRFIIVGTSVAWFFGIIFNIILPWFNNYSYIWLGPIFTIIMIISIAYAVVKHHLFNLKVIATEIITFLMWIGILIRTFLSVETSDLIVNSVFLVLTTIFGILLIRSVLKEVESRERIEHLAGELAGANQQLQELSRQKTEFLSMASHQFRSPLTAIKGYSSMLLEGSFGAMGEKVSGAVDKIFQSSQLLVSVIDDFLNISRIELGKLKFHFEATDLGRLLRETIESQKPAIEKTGLSFTLTMDKKKDFTATLDSEKIRQVVLNLLDNALKYTSGGKVHISLSRNDGVILLSIQDTGAGISPENIDGLFEKFNRADAAKAKTSGTGLGLYIAKNIVDAHNGTIWAESAGKGKGATFTISLPAGVQEKLLSQNALQ
ncbi:MAG: hypothetical protein HYS59_01625 [Candidatus Vogelbacteria bacterium]|nr:hypothetical protein [Candidatus Vogelbacteria bacterium]